MAFVGLFLALLAVPQIAGALPVSTNEALLDAGDFATMVDEHGDAAPAETIPKSPCVHHQPGTQCAPCPPCSTPATEVSELLAMAGVNVSNHDPPRVEQRAPASVFKPPRQTR